MGIYGGTGGNDTITPTGLSPGVVAIPLGTTPGAGPDSLNGGLGNDTLNGGAGRDTLIGRLGGDHLIGGKGPDNLDGGGNGVDIMEGGAGNDFYVVGSSDLVIEDTATASGGKDTVLANFTYTLGFGLENLRLPTGRDTDGTGNALNNMIRTLPVASDSNVLRGLGGDDRLMGGGGADELRGGAGDDSLDGGLQGDRLRGGAGDDQLKGDLQEDWLRGGGGNDAFVFDRLAESGDTISDFGSANGDDDRIVIDASSFGGGLVSGSLPDEQFQASLGHDAQNAEVRFIFDTQDTTLWFDNNGDAAGGLRLVANLQATAVVTHEDVWLI